LLNERAISSTWQRSSARANSAPPIRTPGPKEDDAFLVSLVGGGRFFFRGFPNHESWSARMAQAGCRWTLQVETDGGNDCDEAIQLGEARAGARRSR
jgi:hypothetical protein